jgi:hypothetical protein
MFSVQCIYIMKDAVMMLMHYIGEAARPCIWFDVSLARADGAASE